MDWYRLSERLHNGSVEPFSFPTSTTPAGNPRIDTQETKARLRLTLAVLAVILFVTIPAEAHAFSIFDAIGGTLSGFGASPANASGVVPAIHNIVDTPALAPAVNLNPNPAKGASDIAIADGVALVPEEGPSGTLADINTAPPGSGQTSLYVVRPGASIAGIAKPFNVTTNTIIWANNLDSKGTIHPGDSLVILPVTGIQHTVAKGETLASLAKKYSADAGDIAQYNGLSPSAPLVIGSDIIIPNGEIAAPAPRSSGSGIVIRGTTIREPYLGGSGPAIPGYFAVPIASGIITQGLHGWNAIDIGAPRGTPIYAAADGTVIVARSGGYNGGYGSYVVIQHPNGTQTLYGHMSKVLVSAGQGVGQGQTIGLVGATGLATGAHLHFEVRGAQNPLANVPVGTRE